MMIGSNFWDKYAKSYHTFSEFSKPNNAKYFEITELILSYSSTRILDLGCGSGIMEQILISKGYSGEIIGIDSSPNMIKLANYHNKEQNVHFYNEEIENYSSTKRFDCILAINSIFLINSIDKIILKIKHQLEDRGLCIIVNPIQKGKTKNFIVENFKKENIFINIKHFFQGLLKIFTIFKTYQMQSQLDKMEISGLFRYYNENEIINKFKKNNFTLLFKKDIQAKQNYLLVMQK